VRAADLDALIVTDPVSIHHLTGFDRTAFAVVLVAAGWAEFVTVEGYAGEADGLAAGWAPTFVTRGAWGRALEILRDRLDSGARVGFQSEQVTHALYVQIEGGLAALGPELVAADEPLAALRAVKSPAEVTVLRAAAAPLQDMLSWLCEQRLSGRREHELGWMIERRLREQTGVEALAFDTVVGAGPHGASPHHTATDTVIEPGTLLVIDVGCVVDGYRSDMTRTFAVGAVDAEAAELYGLVARAQHAALAAVAPSVTGSAVHEAAAAVIAGAGHGDRFLHGVGHGIGLELHEPPFCEPGDEQRLQPGHVITVEPGVYLPGLFGVRIEDEVVVGAHGHELLSAYTTDLVVCD
jgi:Xaa-Pro aminopeptidase